MHCDRQSLFHLQLKYSIQYRRATWPLLVRYCPLSQDNLQFNSEMVSHQAVGWQLPLSTIASKPTTTLCANYLSSSPLHTVYMLIDKACCLIKYKCEWFTCCWSSRTFGFAFGHGGRCRADTGLNWRYSAEQELCGDHVSIELRDLKLMQLSGGPVSDM